MMFIVESKASVLAHSMSLNYYGFGRWGIDGLVSHHTVKGVLVPYIRKTPKVKIVAGKPTKSTHPHVHEDDNLVFHKGAVYQPEFSKKIPTKNKEASCLYLQVLHSLALQSNVSIPDMMKKYNPPGDELYGISLPKIINGFKRVEGLDPKVHTAADIDEAINIVRSGTPVICMVKTFGAIMRSMSLKGPSKDKVKKTGILDVTQHDESGREGLYHALMLVGYDKKNGRVLFRDSESEYARNGFFSVDINYFKKKNPDEILRFLAITPK